MKKKLLFLSLIAILFLLGTLPNASKVEAASTTNIVFHTNYGSDTKITKSYTGGQTITLPSATSLSSSFSRSGYYFAGWTTSSSSTTANYKNQASYYVPPSQVASSVNLYATWLPNLKTSNGSTVAMSSTYSGYSGSLTSLSGDDAIDITVYMKKDGEYSKLTTLSSYPTMNTYNGMKNASGADEVYFVFNNVTDSENDYYSHHIYAQGLMNCHTWSFLSLLNVSETNRGKYLMSSSTSLFNSYKDGTFSTSKIFTNYYDLPTYGTILESSAHSGIVVGCYRSGGYYRPMVAEANSGDGTHYVALHPLNRTTLANSSILTKYHK